jgi:hypothetical protein
MITGKPISLATFFASSVDSIGSGLPGRIGTPAACHRATSFNFVAHHRDDIRTRSDKFDIAVFADLRERRRLGKKSVARMDRVDIRHFSRADDRGDIQIALCGRRRADANRSSA